MARVLLELGAVLACPARAAHEGIRLARRAADEDPVPRFPRGAPQGRLDHGIDHGGRGLAESGHRGDPCRRHGFLRILREEFLPRDPALHVVVVGIGLPVPAELTEEAAQQKRPVGVGIALDGEADMEAPSGLEALPQPSRAGEQVDDWNRNGAHGYSVIPARMRFFRKLSRRNRVISRA